MADSIETRVRTVIADVLDAPPELVRPETSLSLADLGWKGFLMITLEIEHEFRVAMPVEVPNGWTSVADVIMATERAIAQAAQRNAA
jgi:acyl carrier protein